MAQTIQIKNGTGSSSPSTLAQGELAINVSSGSLWYGSGSSNTTHSSFHISELTCSAMLDSNGNYAPGSGNISSSGTMYSNVFNVQGHNLGYYINDTISLAWEADIPISIGKTKNPISLKGIVTASGGISASGALEVNDSISLNGPPLITTSGDTFLLDKAGTYTAYVFGRGNQIRPIEMNGHITATGDITASSNISASGNIYSNNTKVISSGFQLLNSMASESWYGPNQQGPSYYYWNKVYPDKPTLTYWNSGYHLPCKAELISVRMVLTNFSNGTDTTFTTKCQILPAPTWPLDDVDDVNDPILETAEYSVTALLRFGGYEATGPLSGSYDAGTIIYPRIKSSVGAINSRGHYEIRYREII